jgi:hypothetical protein
MNLKKRAPFLIGLVFLLTLSACKEGQSKGRRAVVHEHEARLSDIPFRFDLVTREVQESAGSGKIKLRFSSDKSAKNLINFYQQEMVELGWHFVASFELQEGTLLLFSKIYKMAIVIVCSKKKRDTRITVLVCQKEE